MLEATSHPQTGAMQTLIQCWWKDKIEHLGKKILYNYAITSSWK